jgi:hypothetical protein
MEAGKFFRQTQKNLVGSSKYAYFINPTLYQGWSRLSRCIYLSQQESTRAIRQKAHFYVPHFSISRKAPPAPWPGLKERKKTHFLRKAPVVTVVTWICKFTEAAPSRIAKIRSCPKTIKTRLPLSNPVE